MYIIDFFKHLFRRANIGAIIYLVLNVAMFISFFGGLSEPSMAAFAVIVYLISLCIALSPIGEWILRMQTGCKAIKRRDHLDRLMPLFQEVYARAKQQNPELPDGIQLYMCNDSSPNAFATGRKTICLTKGFLSYSDAQIKGTLAHEFGHLAHKDTDLLLLISVGNMLVSIVFVIYRLIVRLFVIILGVALDSIATVLSSLLIDLVLVLLMRLWTWIGTMLVLHSGRQNEFEADKYAHQLGYGADLAVVLDSFEDSDGSKGLWANLHSTHPDTNERIAKLQELGVGYTNAFGHSVHAINANPGQYGYQHSTPPVVPQMPPGMSVEQGYNHAPAGQGGIYPLPVAAVVPQGSGAPAYQPPQQAPPPPGPYPQQAQPYAPPPPVGFQGQPSVAPSPPPAGYQPQQGYAAPSPMAFQPQQASPMPPQPPGAPVQQGYSAPPPPVGFQGQQAAPPPPSGFPGQQQAAPPPPVGFQRQQGAPPPPPVFPGT